MLEAAPSRQAVGNSIKTIISWRSLTTFLHNRGFDANGQALRLDDVHFVAVETCLNEAIAISERNSDHLPLRQRLEQMLGHGSESLDLTHFQGPLPHRAKVVVHCHTHVLDPPW